MGDNAVSCRAAGSWRGKAPHTVAAAAVGAVIALTGTACSATSGALAKAPAVIVLKQGANNSDGDIFITPSGGSVSGPEIISNTGKVIWFHPLPAHELAADFRAQTYEGKPVLSWWQGPPDLGAVSGGADLIYNDRYQKFAEVKGGNGYSADGQEFLITPWNTALILADTVTTANLTFMGGPPTRRSSTASCRRSTSAPARCSSSGTPLPTSPTGTASSRGPPRPPLLGTGSTSTPSTSTPTATC
jgi:hypothetical protein